MTLEIDINQVRAAPAPKKSRLFGHVMLIATICIIVVAFIAYPAILLASVVTGFLTLGGYFGFSDNPNGQLTINENEAERSLKESFNETNEGYSGVGPLWYLGD